MQNDFVNPGAIMEVPMARRNLPNMQMILSVCRHNNVPVVFTTHVLYDEYEISPLEVVYQPWLQQHGMRAGTPGIEVVAELQPMSHEIVVHKHRYDAFHNTPLQTILDNINAPRAIDTLIITGTVTDVCCESTARSAYMRDYKVAFISDACGGLDQQSHAATLNVMARVFGRVLTTGQLLAELH